jgi:hypothetical protein
MIAGQCIQYLAAVQLASMELVPWPGVELVRLGLELARAAALEQSAVVLGTWPMDRISGTRALERWVLELVPAQERARQSSRCSGSRALMGLVPAGRRW